GLVAPCEEHHAVERIRPDRLLDVHGHEVPVEHGRRLHQRLTEREDRKLEREAASLEDAALHGFCEATQVDVAVDELAPAVADADDRAPAKRLVGHARRLEPRAVKEPIEVATLEPFGAAEASVASFRRNVPHASLLGLAGSRRRII